MDIIDSHVHLISYRDGEYPWITDELKSLRRDFLAPDLGPLLDAAAVSSVVAVAARQVVAETDWLLALARQWPRIAAVVGWVDLRHPRVEAELDRWDGQRTLSGFRHVVIDEPDPDFLERPEVIVGIAALGRRGYVYDLLLLPHQLAGAARVAAGLADQRFVLDHAGLPDIRAGAHAPWAIALRGLAQCDNVAMKLSALDFRADWAGWTAADLLPYLDTAFELFGPDRLMIASNWPVSTLSATYAATLGVIRDYVATLSVTEQSEVLAGTARRCYGIEA